MFNFSFSEENINFSDIKSFCITSQANAWNNFHHKLSECSFYFAFVYENNGLDDDAHT